MSGVLICRKSQKCRPNRRHRFCYLLVIRQLCVISRQCLCGVLTVLYKPYLINVKQDTSAVSLEGRKAYYLKMRIYLGAVVHKFKRFAVKRRTLISFQPLSLASILLNSVPKDCPTSFSSGSFSSLASASFA